MTSVSPPSVFQPTLPARGATVLRAVHRARLAISTHAPRTGSDGTSHMMVFATILFQPTLPARGATFKRIIYLSVFADFNPRSPHGERPSQSTCAYSQQNFNPRSPHGERRTEEATRGRTSRRNFNPRSPHGERQQIASDLTPIVQFQPTLPARGATRNTTH